MLWYKILKNEEYNKLKHQLEQLEEECQRLHYLDSFNRDLQPINKKLTVLSNTNPEAIARLYTLFKWIKNAEIVNAMKARTWSDIEIRDKICMFFDMVLTRLAKEYKNLKDQSIEDVESMI